MLSGLYIRNYALIQETRISFDKGFNIITGETGAGKSIMLGALGLILGNRADSKTLENATEKCIVEGVFRNNNSEISRLFQVHDLDFDSEIILRREITPSGKSRAFVNDTPVMLTVLKEIGERLVDIHSQHSNLLLNDGAFRLDLIDAFAANHSIRQTYSDHFHSWKKASNELDRLIEENRNFQRDFDYIKFQLDELDSLRISEGEYERNEGELDVLNSSEKIGDAITLGIQLLDQGEVTILEHLSNLRSQFAQLSRINDQFAQIHQRLDSTWLELKDIYHELEHLSDGIQFDPARLDELNERQQSLQRIFRKHQVENEAELLQIVEEMRAQIEKASHSTEDLEYWKKEEERTRKSLQAIASELTASRKSGLKQTATAVTELLRELGIPDAVFDVQLEELDFSRISPKGLDLVRFLFSANKGGQPGSVSKTASGGEISRIMLALKYLLAGSSRFPTMIFDEIDLGISGEVAIKMGGVMSKMAQNHQIISITHLPQIAAMGQKHFRVSKFSDHERSYSQIEALPPSERIAEIGQMIGGAMAGENAIESAKELLQKFATLN